ncbi:hypothetical protein EDD16DRAFT_1733626 [Pisolithus croceorrhizus]|nr:hypothetical protein EDD16DRAFT_1733626 [Pisolithus croceorrhizus]
MPLVPGYYAIHRLTNLFSARHSVRDIRRSLHYYFTRRVGSPASRLSYPSHHYAVWNWAWFGETAGLLPNLGLGSFFHDNSHGITWVLSFAKTQVRVGVPLQLLGGIEESCKISLINIRANTNLDRWPRPSTAKTQPTFGSADTEEATLHHMPRRYRPHIAYSSIPVRDTSGYDKHRRCCLAGWNRDRHTAQTATAKTNRRASAVLLPLLQYYCIQISLSARVRTCQDKSSQQYNGSATQINPAQMVQLPYLYVIDSSTAYARSTEGRNRVNQYTRLEAASFYSLLLVDMMANLQGNDADRIPPASR